MRNRTMIYYVPGWISLALIWAGFLLFLDQRGVFDQKASIRIVSYRAKDFNASEIGPRFPERQFINTYLVGGKNGPTIDSVQRDLQEFKFARDTLNGLKITIDSTAKYQSLISVLDIIREEGLYWWLIEGTLWVWFETPRSSVSFKPIFFCGTGLIEMQAITKRLKEEKNAQTKQRIQQISMKIWPLWLVFFALAILSLAVFRHKK